MRAQNTTTTSSRAKGKARHAVLVLAVCSLAIPATANAEPLSSPDFASPDSSYSSLNAITGPTSAPSGSAGSAAGDSDYSSLNSITGPPADAPTFVSGSPTGTSDPFDWPSALVGAGAVLALVALAGAALLSVRRRTSVAHSTS